MWVWTSVATTVITVVWNAWNGVRHGNQRMRNWKVLNSEPRRQTWKGISSERQHTIHVELSCGQLKNSDWLPALTRGGLEIFSMECDRTLRVVWTPWDRKCVYIAAGGLWGKPTVWPNLVSNQRWFNKTWEHMVKPWYYSLSVKESISHVFLANSSPSESVVTSFRAVLQVEVEETLKGLHIGEEGWCCGVLLHGCHPQLKSWSVVHTPVGDGNNEGMNKAK